MNHSLLLLIAVQTGRGKKVIGVGMENNITGKKVTGYHVRPIIRFG